MAATSKQDTARPHDGWLMRDGKEGPHSQRGGPTLSISAPQAVGFFRGGTFSLVSRRERRGHDGITQKRVKNIYKTVCNI